MDELLSQTSLNLQTPGEKDYVSMMRLLNWQEGSVRSVNAFKNILGTLPAGWRIPVIFRRAGRPSEIFVELAGVHTPAMLNELMAGRRARPAQNKPGDNPEPKPNPLAP